MARRVMVTGAAMGIRLAVAEKLRSDGHYLVLMDIDGPALEAARARRGVTSQS